MIQYLGELGFLPKKSAAAMLRHVKIDYLSIIT